MNCLDNLDKCQAECCKTFTIFVPGLDEHPRYKEFSLPIPPDADTKWYLALHGVKMRGDRMFIKKAAYKKIGPNTYVFHRRCSNLTDENTCKEWESGDRPQACKDFNEETANEPGFYITPNCIFRRNKP